MSEIQRYWTSCEDGIFGHVPAPQGKGDWVKHTDCISALRQRDERIAALEKQVAEPWEHSEHWLNPETGQVECECCCKWALDAAEDHKTIATLRKQNARLSAPVTDAEWLRLCAGDADYIQRSDIENLMAARKGAA